MKKPMNSPKHPTGLTLLLLKLPNHFYRLGLGRLLGRRMLLINHVGHDALLLTEPQAVETSPPPPLRLLGRRFGG